MQHKFIKVLAIDILDHCSLRVYFDNGTVREINLEPVLYGELYEPLRNHDFFRQAIVDDEAGTIVWPNGADFDPDLLYAWDEHVEAFATQMRKVEQS
ncbi:MAG: DUF2442 domain-containing protein [Chlorobiaceae bacterium]|nr:DUF2442 domain-containing protein [Chlorobiaceae bacterium]